MHGDSSGRPWELSLFPETESGPGALFDITLVPVLKTTSFGHLEYGPEDVIDFPEGLPGFEQERQFLLIERPEIHPVCLLQSVSTASLLFLCVPVAVIDPAYDLKVLPDYYSLLGWEGGRAVPGAVTVLAILCWPERGPVTANLLGPLVIDREARRGVQAIRDDARYSATTPVAWRGEAGEAV